MCIGKYVFAVCMSEEEMQTMMAHILSPKRRVELSTKRWSSSQIRTSGSATMVGGAAQSGHLVSCRQQYANNGTGAIASWWDIFIENSRQSIQVKDTSVSALLSRCLPVVVISHGRQNYTAVAYSLSDGIAVLPVLPGVPMHFDTGARIM